MNNQQHLRQALNPGREATLASYACQAMVDHMYVDDLMYAFISADYHPFPTWGSATPPGDRAGQGAAPPGATAT